MARKKEDEQVLEPAQEGKTTYSIDDVKADICELMHDRIKYMMRGADRVNDPIAMNALAGLYNAIK
jgi:hypothetical protein